MLRHTEDLEALDRTRFCHPSTDQKPHPEGLSPTRIVEGGDGVLIKDRDGRALLDGFAPPLTLSRTEADQIIDKRLAATLSLPPRS